MSKKIRQEDAAARAKELLALSERGLFPQIGRTDPGSNPISMRSEPHLPPLRPDLSAYGVQSTLPPLSSESSTDGVKAGAGGAGAQRALQIRHDQESIKKAADLGVAFERLLGSSTLKDRLPEGSGSVALFRTGTERTFDDVRGDWIGNGMKDVVQSQTAALELSRGPKGLQISLVEETTRFGAKTVLDPKFAAIGVPLTDEEWAVTPERRAGSLGTSSSFPASALEKVKRTFPDLTPSVLAEAFARLF